MRSLVSPGQGPPTSRRPGCRSPVGPASPSTAADGPPPPVHSRYDGRGARRPAADSRRHDDRRGSPADHPRRPAARRPAPAGRRGRLRPRRRPRPGQRRCGAGAPRRWSWSARTWPAWSPSSARRAATTCTSSGWPRSGRGLPQRAGRRRARRRRAADGGGLAGRAAHRRDRRRGRPRRRRPPGHTVGVVAGSGGAGATTFACAVALTAARRQRTALVDLDPLGPGVDRVVGLDGRRGPAGTPWRPSRGRLGSRSLRAALPDKDGLAVLTWGTGAPTGLDAAAVREVLSAARRGNDVVVGRRAALPRRRHRRGGHPLRPRCSS